MRLRLCNNLYYGLEQGIVPKKALYEVVKEQEAAERTGPEEPRKLESELEGKMHLKSL